MIVTNKGNLPEPLVMLVSNGDRAYPLFNVSVTRLLQPSQMVALEREHGDEITEDASERIWASFGSMMHHALANMPSDNMLVEEEFSQQVGTWLVTGRPDLVEQIGHAYRITDWKFVGVGTTFNGPRDEWVSQLNLYAHLLRQSGFDVRQLQVTAIYRDWIKAKAHIDGYPPPAQNIPVPLWEPKVAETFLMDRLATYASAVAGLYVPCTPEERWERPTRYAVTKKGNKRAARLLDSQEEAEQWAEDNVPNGNEWTRWFEIAQRSGESVRCASYCRVSRWCQQWKSLEPA